MSNKRKQGDERTDLQKYNEREYTTVHKQRLSTNASRQQAEDPLYKALKKEKNIQLKEAVEDDCAERKREITGELNASKLKDKCLKLLNSLASSPSTSRPLPPVARVHDPCLIALFKQLPPADKLTARKVCRRWTDLVTYAARSTRTLAILLGDQTMKQFAKSVNYYSLDTIKIVSLLKKEDGSRMLIQSRFTQWNALLFREGLDEATVEAIVDTFVNLDTLQIGLIEAPSTQLDFISLLLELLAHHQLTTLKLYEAPYPLKNHSPDRLIAAINGLSTLKNLHLDLYSLPYGDLPIIAQLEQLLIYWPGCPPHHFAALLRQHATDNTSLRSVKYICNDHNSDIEQFTSLSDHLLARFTHFGFLRSQFTNSQLISTHFRHLTNLFIHPTNITLRRLFDHLSQLSQLLYLGLDIHFSLLLPDDQPHLLLPQLKSVKALELRLVICSHLDLEQLKIGWTMPNLQAIDLCHFWLSKCTDCTIEEFIHKHIEANLATFKRCYRQMFTSLKANCSQLHTILYNFERFLGSADELLAQ